MKPLFILVSHDDFFNAVNVARETNTRIAENVTPYTQEQYKEFMCFLDKDKKAGFALHGQELCSVFSTKKGMGAHIVQYAKEKGAAFLDCFDGYLPKLYASAGFVEVKREKNWNINGPDVVYMKVAA